MLQRRLDREPLESTPQAQKDSKKVGDGKGPLEPLPQALDQPPPVQKDLKKGGKGKTRHETLSSARESAGLNRTPHKKVKKKTQSRKQWRDLGQTGLRPHCP